MTPAAPISVGWYRERVIDSGRRRSWRQRLGTLAFASSLALTWCLGSRLGAMSALVLWGAWLLGLLGYLHYRRVRFFGPVCFHDLVRAGRQSRYTLLRIAYVSVMLFTLTVVYAGWLSRNGGSLVDVLYGGTLDIRDMAWFAQSFFVNFAWVQFLVAVVLTPLYVGSSLTEEKERSTLEGVLASDLEDQEIILGKMTSRIAHLLLVVLAGLPVLAFTQFFGGVAPELVLACFAFTAITVLSLASLSMLCSVYARRTANAVFSVFLWSGAFLAVTFLLRWFVFVINFYVISMAIPYLYGIPDWLDTIPPLSYGNPILAVYDFAWRLVVGEPFGEVLLSVLTEYALFHVALTVWCSYKAVRQLRRKALQPEAPTPLWRRASVEFPPRLHRPPLGTWPPLLWKEIHADAPVGSHRFSALVMYLHMILGWFLVALFLAFLMFSVGLMSEEPSWLEIRVAVNGWVRGMGSFLATVMLVAVAFYAAGGVSRERERQTLDGLLTLPLERSDIIWAKWLGTPFAVRPLWWCLGIIWGLGVVTGGLHILALPLLIVAWWTYAAFLSGLGLWFSVRIRSTMRAAVWTLFTLFMLVFIDRLVVNNHDLFFSSWLPGAVDAELTRWLDYGLMPPFALVTLSFGYDDLPQTDGELASQPLRAALIGVLFYAAAAWGLWLWNRRYFRQLTDTIQTEAPVEASPPVTRGSPVHS